MGFDKTLVLTIAAELLALAGITWAVNRLLDKRQQRKRQDRQVAAIISGLDADLAELLGAPETGGQP